MNPLLLQQLRNAVERDDWILAADVCLEINLSAQDELHRLRAEELAKARSIARCSSRRGDYRSAGSVGRKGRPGRVFPWRISPDPMALGANKNRAAGAFFTQAA